MADTKHNFPEGTSYFFPWVDHETPVNAENLNWIGFEFHQVEYNIGINAQGGFGTLKGRFENNESRISSVEGDYVKKSGGNFEGNVGFNYFNVEYSYIYSTARLNFAGEGITAIGIKDEDDMSSDSDKHLATQQSIKAYAKRKRMTGSFVGYQDEGVYSIIGTNLGPYIQSVDDYAYAWLIMPDDLTELLSLKIKGASWGVNVNGMRLALAINGGGNDQGNAIRNTGYVYKTSTTGLSVVGNILEWIIDKNDSAVISQFLPGDCVRIIARGAPWSAPVDATQVNTCSWELEYK